MNGALKSALTSSQASVGRIRAAFFHSTPVLERKRRKHWDARSNNCSNSYSKRYRKLQSKQSLLRNVNAFADFLFQKYEDEAEEDSNDPFSSRGGSWFQQQMNKGSKKKGKGGPSQHFGRKGFQFCEEEVDVETIFKSAFGGTRCFYWSFVNDENPEAGRGWRSNSHNSSHKRYTNWGYHTEDEYEYYSSSSSSSSESEMSNGSKKLVSERLALGLNASGPLKLDDVKIAYRACALKWHPDRHQGSSKVVAEEKFKLCSAAYQSLCDQLAVAR